MNSSVNDKNSDETKKVKLTHPVHWLAFGFGSGLAPKAPGTFGTLAAVPIYFLMAQLPLEQYVVVLIITTLLGIYFCHKTAKDLGVHDHPGIVWDEFVGYWLTMIALPVSIYWAIAGFVLFRLFDIWKPWPIRNLDEHVDGGLGIMVDDLVAALYAIIILQLAHYFIG